MKKVAEKSNDSTSNTGAKSIQSLGKKIDYKDEDYQLGNLFQGKSVSFGSKNNNLNAKKLDINFDADDFFNSFEPTNIAPKPAKVEIK